MRNRAYRRHQTQRHMWRRLKEDRNQHYEDLTCPCWSNERVNMPNHLKDITGQTFGRLTVIKRIPSTYQNDSTKWECQCICGNKKIIVGSKLRRGHTTSCGCFRDEMRSKNATTHGMSFSTEYESWNAMMSRCYYSKSQNWKLYGGRGIKVCPRWHEFEYFYADMGSKPSPFHTINRIDNNKGYSPNNCVWSTAKEQANNKRNNHILTAFNKTQTLAQWSDEYRIKPSTLRERLERGWPPEKALLTPIKIINKAMARFKEQPKVCSCWMCRNPRRTWKTKDALTISEQRFYAQSIVVDEGDID